MGLDVYLYHWQKFEEDVKREEEYKRKCSKIWEEVGQGKSYSEMTEEEKDKAYKLCEELKEKMGLVGWGETLRKTKIELPSQKYPDHLFKIGYFRSSYNNSGFNTVMSEIGLPDLYDIFNIKSGKTYHITPNWKESLERTNKAIKAFKDFLKKPISKYQAVFCNSIDKVGSTKEALRVFEKELKEEHPFCSYSSRKGHFYLDEPLKVYGVVSGKNIIGDEGVYLIYEVSKEFYEWYLQALEIVKETIEYVLNNPKEGKYILHWSS